MRSEHTTKLDAGALEEDRKREGTSSESKVDALEAVSDDASRCGRILIIREYELGVKGILVLRRSCGALSPQADEVEQP